jgi:hypothetical protein
LFIPYQIYNKQIAKPWHKFQGRIDPISKKDGLNENVEMFGHSDSQI